MGVRVPSSAQIRKSPVLKMGLFNFIKSKK